MSLTGDLLNDIGLRAADKPKDSSALGRGHLKVRKACLDMADENLPIALADAHSLMRGFHVASDIQEGAAS